jgi:hypothetical protein
MSISRLLAGAALALAVLAPTGCVSVPDSGPVRVGPEAESEVETSQQYVRVAKGPADGAQQAEIVRGYLAAMRALPADPEVVREFMTEEASVAWEPDRGATVFTGLPLLRVSGKQVTVSLSRLGSLDRRGTWTSTPPAKAAAKTTFQLVQVDGEWRITNPVEGLLIDQDFFEDFYSPFSLYFFDPTGRILVPDQVYLPDGVGTATQLIRGLADGPTAWLANGVGTGGVGAGGVGSFVPPSTDPDVTVPVDAEGLATVPLSPDVLSYAADQRELLAVQLAWTLRQMPSIRSIRVVADGAPVPLVSDSEDFDPDYGSKYDPADAGATRTLYALRDGRLLVVGEESAEPVQGVLGGDRARVERFGVDRDGRVAATVTGGGTTLGVAGITGPPSRLEPWFDMGVDLGRPQWDFHGLLWAVDRRPGRSVFYAMADGRWRVVRVAGGGPAPRSVRAFTVSRDGMRIAVIDGRGTGSRLLVGRVERTAKVGRPLRLDRWRVVVTPTQPLRDFRDLAWASPTELAVIARGGDAPQQFTVDIDGSDVGSTALAAFDPRWVAATPTQDTQTVVGAAAGAGLYSQTDDQRWTPLLSADDGAGLTRPAYVE